MSDELLDRIAAPIWQNSRLTKDGAEGIAQKIIDELGLRYETAHGGSYEHPNQRHRRLVGRWEDE